MAVFLMNVCKFNGCGITFRTLGDLIQHIEDTHIDFDPGVLEKQESQQPPCIPISYVLRFFTDAAKKDSLDYLKKQKRAHSPAVSVCSTTPSGSEFDEEELVSGSDDSNESWTTQEEFSSEFILRYGSRMVGNTNPNEEKPFACPVPGCKKRYKNINGIKYHAKNGHRKDVRVKKGFRCQCGKSYKTAKGLRVHTHVHHNGGTPAAIVESMPTIVGDPLQVAAITLGNSSCSVNAAQKLLPPLPYSSIAMGAVASFPSAAMHCLSETPMTPTSVAVAAPCQMSTVSPTTLHAGLPNSLLTTTPPPTPTSLSPASHTASSPTYAMPATFNHHHHLSHLSPSSGCHSAMSAGIGHQTRLVSTTAFPASYPAVSPLSPATSPYPVLTL